MAQRGELNLLLSDQKENEWHKKQSIREFKGNGNSQYSPRCLSREEYSQAKKFKEAKQTAAAKSPRELWRNNSQKLLGKQKAPKEHAVVKRIAVALNSENISYQPDISQRFKRNTSLSKKELRIEKFKSPFVHRKEGNQKAKNLVVKEGEEMKWKVKTIQLEIKTDLENQMRKLQDRKAKEESHKRQKSLNMKKFILKQLETNSSFSKENNDQLREKTGLMSTEIISISFDDTLSHSIRSHNSGKYFKLSEIELNNKATDMKLFNKRIIIESEDKVIPTENMNRKLQRVNSCIQELRENSAPKDYFNNTLKINRLISEAKDPQVENNWSNGRLSVQEFVYPKKRSSKQRQYKDDTIKEKTSKRKVNNAKVKNMTIDSHKNFGNQKDKEEEVISGNLILNSKVNENIKTKEIINKQTDKINSISNEQPRTADNTTEVNQSSLGTAEKVKGQMFVIGFENVLDENEKKKLFEAFRRRREQQEEERQKHKVISEPKLKVTF